MFEYMMESKQVSPERRLLVAVLERALLDYVGNQKNEKDEAISWFFDDENIEEEFSFAWVCRELDIEPSAVLSRIDNMGPRGDLTAQQWWGQRPSRLIK